MPFKIGDVVYLKSGGPAMTFLKLRDDGYAVTMWFSRKDKTRTDIFEPEMLKLDRDDEDGFYEDYEGLGKDQPELSDEELDSLVAQSEYYKHRGN